MRGWQPPEVNESCGAPNEPFAVLTLISLERAACKHWRLVAFALHEGQSPSFRAHERSASFPRIQVAAAQEFPLSSRTRKAALVHCIRMSHERILFDQHVDAERQYAVGARADPRYWSAPIAVQRRGSMTRIATTSPAVATCVACRARRNLIEAPENDQIRLPVIGREAGEGNA